MITRQYRAVRLNLRRVLLSVCVAAASAALAATTEETAPSLDPTHGVVLRGSEGQAVAEACGGTSVSAGWTLRSGDLDRLERQLAPLLGADLQNVGSTSVPRQYYRQYATGRLGSRQAVFVNGFHESQIPITANQSSWRRSAVIVSDGGDSYWCAIYIKETREFVKFKGRHFDTHVWFHGLA